MGLIRWLGGGQESNPKNPNLEPSLACVQTLFMLKQRKEDKHDF